MSDTDLASLQSVIEPYLPLGRSGLLAAAGQAMLSVGQSVIRRAPSLDLRSRKLRESQFRL